MTKIDECIERIKATTQTIVDLLGEIDEQRRKDIAELAKRVSAVEYEQARQCKKDK